MGVTQRVFDEVERLYGKHWSWAVWGEAAGTVAIDRQSDLRFPADELGILETLHTNTVLVGLNPGNAFTAGLWETFHTGSKHNDHRLAEAIRGTDAWGGFMADLIDTVESNSTLIDTGNQFDNETRVRDLIGRMRDAGIDTRGQTWIAIGGKTQQALDAAQAILRHEEISILAIPHYSGAANGAIVRRFAQSHSVTGDARDLSVGQELNVDQKYRLLVQDVLEPIK